MINPVSFRYEGVFYPHYGYQTKASSVQPVGQVKNISPVSPGASYAVISTRKPESGLKSYPPGSNPITDSDPVTQIKYNLNNPYENTRKQFESEIIAGMYIDVLA